MKTLRLILALSVLLWAVCPARASTFVIDNFTGTAGASLAGHSGQLGGAWSLPAGGYQFTAAGQIRVTVTAQVCAAVNATSPASADYSHAIDWIVSSIDTSGMNAGVGVRFDAAGQNGYVGFYLNTVGWEIYKCVGGALSPIGSAATPFQVTAGSYYHEELQVRGNSLTLLASGNVVATATDSTFTGAGYPALYCYQGSQASDSQGIQIDNSIVSLFTDAGSPSTQVVDLGDSRDYGYGATSPGTAQTPGTSYLALALQSLGPTFVGRNQGIPGDTLAQMHARRAVWQALASNAYAHNIFALGDAVNSLATGSTAAQAFADLQTLIADVPAGSDYRVVTTLPVGNGNASVAATRGDYNALIRANIPASKIIDFDADSRIGSDTAPSGSNYVDLVHLSDAGQAIQAPIFAASFTASTPTLTVTVSTPHTGGFSF